MYRRFESELKDRERNKFDYSQLYSPVKISRNQRELDPHDAKKERNDDGAPMAESSDNATLRCHHCNLDVLVRNFEKHVTSDIHKTFVKFARSVMDKTMKHMDQEFYKPIVLLEHTSQNIHYCEVCNVEIEENLKKQHANSKRHIVFTNKTTLLKELLLLYSEDAEASYKHLGPIDPQAYGTYSDRSIVAPENSGNKTTEQELNFTFVPSNTRKIFSPRDNVDKTTIKKSNSRKIPSSKKPLKDDDIERANHSSVVNTPDESKRPDNMKTGKDFYATYGVREDIHDPNLHLNATFPVYDKMKLHNKVFNNNSESNLGQGHLTANKSGAITKPIEKSNPTINVKKIITEIFDKSNSTKNVKKIITETSEKNNSTMNVKNIITEPSKKNNATMNLKNIITEPIEKGNEKMTDPDAVKLLIDCENICTSLNASGSAKEEVQLCAESSSVVKEIATKNMETNSHDEMICEICNVVVKVNMESHVIGKKHMKKLEAKQQASKSKNGANETTDNCASNSSIEKSSEKVTVQANASFRPELDFIQKLEKNVMFCNLCQQKINRPNVPEHINGRNHTTNLRDFKENDYKPLNHNKDLKMEKVDSETKKDTSKKFKNSHISDETFELLLAPLENNIECRACKLELSKNTIGTHVLTKIHKENVLLYAKQNPNYIDTTHEYIDASRHYLCTVCNIFIEIPNKAEHELGKKHNHNARAKWN